MKNIAIVNFLLFLSLFLGSGLPYEPQIRPPVETNPLYNVQPEPEKSLVPPRRMVPEEYRSLFNTAASSAGIPPGVLESIAFVESGFNPAAMSPIRENGHRDLGMFQFNSTYLGWYADRYNSGAPFDPMVPEEAAIIAAKHIRCLYDRYHHWPAVCLAYNAGMTAVDKEEIPECSYRYLLKVYEDF